MDNNEMISTDNEKRPEAYEADKKKTATVLDSPVSYIQKYSRNRDKELKYDFMPKILEIIEKPAHKAGTVIILGIFSLLIAAIIWACLSKVDVVVTSGGNIQPEGNLNVVQSYMSGSVKSINVSEGTYVEKGDVLIELDTRSIEIDEKQMDSQKGILEVQKELYMMLINGEDLSEITPDGYTDDVKPYVRAILDTDTSHKNAVAEIELEIDSAEIEYRILEIQLEGYRNSGLADQTKIQALMLDQYSLAIEQLELQLSDIKTQYSIQLNSWLSETDSQLDELEKTYEQYSLAKEYQLITSPVNGYVNSIAVNTIGASVASGQELITVLPADMPLEMVCYVNNMDMADVKTGMEAEIKLEAYPYNRYGTVKGTVKYISPSSFANEQMGNVYLVKLELSEANGNIDIVSGLSGSVEIKTGKRSIMDYFMEPIMKGFGESMKEK